jgi:hypothetical protein
MEAERVAVTEESILRYFQPLSSAVQGVPHSFVFNVDETGCADWPDRRDRVVIVPGDYNLPTIPVPVARHVKRSTLTVCIAADGYCMKPFVIITSEDDREGDILRVRTRSGPVLHSRERFYDRPTFPRVGYETVHPNASTAARRVELRRKAVLLLDGVNPHLSQEFRELCAQNKVEILEFVPQASHILQPLDLVTFSILKNRMNHDTFDRLENPQSNRLVKMLASLYSATAPHLNVLAFQNLGLIPWEDVDAGFFYLRFDMGFCRNFSRYLGRDPSTPMEVLHFPPLPPG